MQKLFVVPVLAAGLALTACDKEPKAASAQPAPAAAAPTAAKAPAPAPADAPKVKVVDGAPPSDDRYKVTIDTPPAKAGQEGKVAIKIEPKSPWHVNMDFPTSLEVMANGGVEVTKPKQKKADAVKFEDESAEFAVAFTANEPGDVSFQGTFKFAVCQDDACSPVTENLEFKVAVN